MSSLRALLRPYVPTTTRTHAPIEERLARGIDYPGNDTDCWIWRRGTNGIGYGQLTVTSGPHRYSHRYVHVLVYELLIGPIPDGLERDHLCRRTLCCNPWHLEPVTHRENILRGLAPAALCAKRTHCPQGHPYDEANTRLYRGSRYCKACARTRWRPVSVRKSDSRSTMSYS